jgi:hypothetical protein
MTAAIRASPHGFPRTKNVNFQGSKGGQMVLYRGVGGVWGTRGECVKPGNTTLFADKTAQNTVAIVVSTSF